MTYFNILSIKYEGDIVLPKLLGQHQATLKIGKVGLEKRSDTDSNFIVEVDYEYFEQNRFVFKLKVTSIFLIVNLDKKQFDRELIFLRFLLGKSVAHFDGVLASKFQDKNDYIHIPDEPPYEDAMEFSKELLTGLFKLA